MGIYESIQRNQNNIGFIEEAVNSLVKKKRDSEARSKYNERFTTTETEMTPELRFAMQTAGLDPEGSLSLNPNEIPVDARERAGKLAGASAPQGPARASMIEPPQTRQVKGFRTPTMNDTPFLAELMEMGPEEMMQLTFGLQAGDDRRATAAREAKRDRLMNVPDAGTLFDVEAGKPVFTDQRDFNPYQYSALTPYQEESLRLRGAELERLKNKDERTSTKASAALKAIETRKNSLQSQIAQMYPGVNLDDVIASGDVPTEWDPDTKDKLARKIYANEEIAELMGKRAPIKSVQEYLQAIADYEARAAVEGIPFTPAYDHAVGKRGARPKSPITTSAGVAAPAAGTNDQEFTLQEARAQHPEYQDIPDDELIARYAKQGVRIKP